MKLPVLIDLPPGRFLMGGGEEDKFLNDTERPQHMVEIPTGLRMARYPVTEDEYFGGGSTQPVVGVSWAEAREFAREVGERLGGRGRLPSEAEWEWAARAGREGSFVPGIGEANFLYDEDGSKVGPGERTPVGTYGENSFGFGDLLGNVCEWVEDVWHPDYLGAPADGSVWEEEDPGRKVVRGGAWDHLPRLLRPSWRDFADIESRRDNLGFRIVVEGGKK